jgi:hypothetical protein
MNMKKYKPILILVMASIAFIAIMMIVNPLFLRTEEQITRRLLQFTPIGISWDDCLEIIRKNDDWRVAYIDPSRGYVNTRLPVGERIVGEQHITVDIGSSSFLMEVRVRWVFDGSGSLVGIFPMRLLRK